MKIINKNKNNILAEEVIVADTPFKRSKGLLGRKLFKPGEALVIVPCNSIHTLFMRFSIDALFVNKEHRVIKAIWNLKPFRITKIYFNSSFVVELPVGTICATATEEGDIISFME
jgi:uncharacterized membrane protein (UPF0127 family)